MVDETNNTWSCVRTLSPAENSMHCVFWASYAASNTSIPPPTLVRSESFLRDCVWSQDVDDPSAKPYFSEHYDIATDLWQLNNTFSALGAADRDRLGRRLRALRHCKGAAACAPPPPEGQ